MEVSGWRFEVIDLDGRRIDKVLASFPCHGSRPITQDERSDAHHEYCAKHNATGDQLPSSRRM